MHYTRDMLYIEQLDDGEKLYHYTTTDALISIVKTNKWWITKWDYLNDVDEFKVALDVCEEVLKEEKIKIEIIQEVKESVKNLLHTNSFNQNYYILSFSCNKDSQLLWSNYSNYDGVNCEIDFYKFIEYFNHNLIWHGLVNYNLDDQKECLRKVFFDEFLDIEEFGKMISLSEINKLESGKYKILVSHMAVICILYSMFFKRKCFEGEKEYRLVFNNENKEGINFRNRNNLIIPYVEKNVDSIDFITQITIGPTNKMDIVEKGIAEFLYHHKRNINIIRSEIPLRF